MVDSTVKPRSFESQVEHDDDLRCECLIAGFVCFDHGTVNFWHNDFDVARVRKVENGHP